MLRVICVEVNDGPAIHVGGPVHTDYRTFDCYDAESIKAVCDWLAAQKHTLRSIVGTEVIKEAKK